MRPTDESAAKALGNDEALNSKFTLLQDGVRAIEVAVKALEPHVGTRKLVDMGAGLKAFRYEGEDDLLLSYLKCVRAVSMLWAGCRLISEGYYQETGILCRCLQESAEDVVYLAAPLGADGRPSKDQSRLVQEFFQEEFADSTKPIQSQQPRDRLSRDKIIAGIAGMKDMPLNASDGATIRRMLHKSFSGYVHGAYSHIMELCGAPGGEPSFYTHGHMPKTPCLLMLEALMSRAYMIGVATCIVAQRCDKKNVHDSLVPTVRTLAKVTDSDTLGDLNAAARRLKQGRPVEKPGG